MAEDIAELWKRMKAALIASLGREGAAEWLAHAAKVMAADARREARDAAQMQHTNAERRPL